MLSKFSSLFKTCRESVSDKPAAVTTHNNEDDAALFMFAVRIMAYMVVRPESRELLSDKWHESLKLVSTRTGLDSSETIKAVSGFSQDLVTSLMEDREKRLEFIRTFESAFPELDLKIHSMTSGGPLPDITLLQEWKDFSGWSGLFRDLSPFEVTAFANEALAIEGNVAMGQTHFWNAIIDHLITSAFMAPKLTEQQRVATMEMVSRFRDVVKALLKEKPEILEACETAWRASAEQALKLKAARDVLYEAGSINRWGQSLER